MIDRFYIERMLPRRVCVAYEVKRASFVVITNTATREAVYSRDVSGDGTYATSPSCIYLKRGVEGLVLTYELEARGPHSEAVRALSVPPRGPAENIAP